jgi:hypothetical protein
MSNPALENIEKLSTNKKYTNHSLHFISATFMFPLLTFSNGTKFAFMLLLTQYGLLVNC